ncbi:MAG TPA: hypothetical protein VHU77_11360 [Candidatus Limnocylindria bacterium]|nr:hypothetical protein [Candidatus Limnocylindria bacterium]
MTSETRAILAELAARALRKRWDPRAFAGQHEPQYGFITDRSPFSHAQCARQSGKTWGDDFILGQNADEHPRSAGLFLGLKGTGVRVSNWVPTWKQGLCEMHGIPSDWHNETSMVTTWPNGSRVMFGGTDDLSNVRKFLGNSLRNYGIVIIDEAQDQPPQVLRYILNTLLPPMLGPKSRIILSGVLPDVPAGPFYDLAHPGGLGGAKCTCTGWRHHEWGRAANIHTPEAMEQLAKYMRDHGLTEDDPQIQRDWFMKRVWDTSATAYRYRQELNGYKAETPDWFKHVDWEHGKARAAVPHDGIDQFTIGIDPGGGDRTSIVVWGWGEHTHEIQHVFEWVTPRDTPVPLSEIASTLAIAVEHYPTDNIFWDPGSGSLEIDTFGTDYGIPLVRAATKTDFPGQVRRNNDLLTKGYLKVIIGSALEEDYQRARFDTEARAKGTWRWSSQWHPDPSEAGRYGLQGYYNAYVEPPKPVPVELAKRAAMIKRQREYNAKRGGNGDPELEEEQLVDDLFG